jgi:hypothetical protein
MSATKDGDEAYSEALARLKKAQAAYSAAENDLIQAERAHRTAMFGTTYYKMLTSLKTSNQP